MLNVCDHLCQDMPRPSLFSRSVALIPWAAFCSSHGWLGAWLSQMHKWRTSRRVSGQISNGEWGIVNWMLMNSVDVSEVVKEFASKARIDKNCKWMSQAFLWPVRVDCDTAVILDDPEKFTCHILPPWLPGWIQEGAWTSGESRQNWHEKAPWHAIGCNMVQSSLANDIWRGHSPDVQGLV